MDITILYQQFLSQKRFQEEFGALHQKQIEQLPHSDYPVPLPQHLTVKRTRNDKSPL